MASRECGDLISSRCEERMCGNDQRIDTLSRKCRKGSFDFAWSARIENVDLHSESTRCVLRILHLIVSVRARIDKQTNYCCPGKQVVEQPQPLCHDLLPRAAVIGLL